MSSVPRAMGILLAQFARRGESGDALVPMETIGQHNATMAGLAKKHGGVVGLENEGTCGAVFETATQAAACAAAAVVRFAERNRGLERAKRISLRLAVHEGGVAFQDERLAGPGLETISRVIPAAPPGRILATREARARADARVRCAFIPLGREMLDGLPDPVELFEVVPLAASERALPSARGGA